MRIAHISCVYPPEAGGIGTVASTYVLALQAAGEEVVVFHPKNTRSIFSHGHAAVIPSLLWLLRGFDVLHLHYPFYGADIFVWMASVLWNIPLVVTYHMKTKSSGWQGWFFELHRRFFEPFILKRARTILVSSKDYAASIGLKHRHLVESPFWIDETVFTPQGKNRRPEFSAGGHRLLFIFVGGLDDAHYFKGMSVLLRAFARLSLERAWGAIIVGDGNLRKQYEEEARKFGLADRVTFVGRVSAEDLPVMYRSADVHLLPSIDRSEAFGMVTLEAGASGLPSLVSDLPGVRTLVMEGETGFILPPKDVEALAEKLRWCLDHAKEIPFFGHRARMRIETTYGTAAGVACLKKVYDEVRG
ncbi:MAG: glycosyltransferase family 4 protein [Patescibacteria group bacterium]|jgi:glycosyltransferase involved in cell wall biosynthesis